VEAKKLSMPMSKGKGRPKGKTNREDNKKSVANTAKDEVKKTEGKRSKKSESEDHTSCGLCGERYGDLAGTKCDDDWLRCSKCDIRHISYQC